MTMNFSDEIKGFEKALEEKRRVLEQYEARRNAHVVQTRKARSAIEDLQAVMRGETPPSQKGAKRSVRGITALEVDPETKRPPRGARRRQILEIARQLGSAGAEFRTADVLGVLRKVEDEVNAGLRSYTYTIMNHLEGDDLVERRGRGRWIWIG